MWAPYSFRIDPRAILNLLVQHRSQARGRSVDTLVILHTQYAKYTPNIGISIRRNLLHRGFRNDTCCANFMPIGRVESLGYVDAHRKCIFWKSLLTFRIRIWVAPPPPESVDADLFTAVIGARKWTDGQVISVHDLWQG